LLLLMETTCAVQFKLDEIASAAMELLVRPRKEVRGTWRRKARGHHDE
jgi:hypothetical protein